MRRKSVVKPAHNNAGTIARALDSVLAQTFSDFEVVVVNDGSTDATAEVVSRYAGRVHVIEQPNQGFCTARNVAIRASRGEYVALLDGDDTWTADKLEKSVVPLDRDPRCVLVYTDVLMVDTAGSDLRRSPVDRETAHAPTLAEMLGRLWPIMPSTVVMRREAYEKCGAFVDGVNEDLDFWIRIREQGRFHYLPEKLTRFTMGPLYPKVLGRDLCGEHFFRTMRER